MNIAHEPLRNRTDLFINNLPVSEKEENRQVFDALIKKVANRSGLTQEDLHLPNVPRDVLDKINTMSRKLTAQTDDPLIVETVADLVGEIIRDKPFGNRSEPLGLMVGNFLLRCANRPIMVFTEDDVKAVRQASSKVNSLRLWMAEHYRDAVQYRGAVYEKVPNTKDTYTANGKKVIIQWNTLVDAERNWRE